MMNEKGCANCINLRFYECPSAHFWCNENKDCPCNGDEVPDQDFYCELYLPEEE